MNTGLPKRSPEAIRERAAKFFDDTLASIAENGMTVQQILAYGNNGLAILDALLALAPGDCFALSDWLESRGMSKEELRMTEAAIPLIVTAFDTAHEEYTHPRVGLVPSDVVLELQLSKEQEQGIAYKGDVLKACEIRRVLRRKAIDGKRPANRPIARSEFEFGAFYAGQDFPHATARIAGHSEEEAAETAEQLLEPSCNEEVRCIGTRPNPAYMAYLVERGLITQ